MAVVDGPFAETKDLIAGWMVIDVDSYERAIESAGELSAAPGAGGEPNPVMEFGRLDLAFNNAGTDGEQVPIHEQDIDKAGVLFDVNIKGVFFCMKYEIEQMLKTGGGAVVNTSSIFGLNGYPGWSLYVATKHAVTGMTKAAALDYAKLNIRVNAVGPGPVETPLLAKGSGGDPHSYASFVPMGRIGQPDEIADAVVWLLSDEARYVTGHTLPVDGGCLPQ